MKKFYTYQDLCSDIANFKRLGANVFSVGKTHLKHNIFCVHVGKSNGTQLIVQGGIHAREHITCALVSRQIYFHLQNNGFDGGIYYLPMVNVDGVMLAQNRLAGIDSDRLNFLTTINGNSNDFSLFKANILGVDLNVNFDAKWGQGKGNVEYPSASGCIGKSPIDQPETQALVNLTRKVMPSATISYHCKGEEIYCSFFQSPEKLSYDTMLANELAQITGYAVKNSEGSCGGYKDWCISKLNITAFTIEVGDDKLQHPLDLSNLKTIADQNLTVPLYLLNRIKRQRKLCRQ